MWGHRQCKLYTIQAWNSVTGRSPCHEKNKENVLKLLWNNHFQSGKSHVTPWSPRELHWQMYWKLKRKHFSQLILCDQMLNFCLVGLKKLTDYKCFYRTIVHSTITRYNWAHEYWIKFILPFSRGLASSETHIDTLWSGCYDQRVHV